MTGRTVFRVGCCLISLLCITNVNTSYAEESKTSVLDFFGVAPTNIKGKLFEPTVNIHGYTQLKFLADKSRNAKSSEFEVTRARLKVFGDINKYISYNVMAGALEPPPARDRKAEFSDIFIDAKFSSKIKLRMGQFFIPFGYEGPKAITINDMIERSMLTALMNSYAIFRDIGVMVFGDIEKFNYSLSITNGAGANKRDENDGKDIMGTVRYSISDELMVGVSGHLGSVGESGERTFNRKRWNAHAVYTPGKFTGIAEFTHREEEDPNLGYTLIRSNGWYALAGYHFFDDFQGIIRYTWMDKNLDGEGDIFNEFALGVNFFYGKHIRIAVNYEIRDEEKNPDVDDLFTLLAQVSY